MGDSEYIICPIHMRSQVTKNYCYIIISKENKDAVVIDPAWELDSILNELQKYNANLKSILLTHSHYDHVNLVEDLEELFHPCVYMSKEEINYYSYKSRNLSSLCDGDTISVGNIKVKCVLTPGHTAGSMCYLIKGHLFTGDTIFTEGCGMCLGSGASAEKMYESVRKLKSIVDMETYVYPGHSFGLPVGLMFSEVIAINIYLQIDNISDFVEFRMRKAQKNLFKFV